MARSCAVETAGARREIELALPGRFQADNALLAAALAAALGEPDVAGPSHRACTVCAAAWSWQRVCRTALPSMSTTRTRPNALERLLTALRPHTAGRLHVVFGAGGDRDRGKRPLMGAAAARLADVAIVTDDNPRSENPATIRAAVLAACPGATRNRRSREGHCGSAERPCVRRCARVAGKGHEQGQTIGNTVIPFDDVDVVRRLVVRIMTAAVDRARSARGDRRDHGRAVRRHRRFDRYAHPARPATCSSPCAARQATVTPSSLTRSPRARPARWCIMPCHRSAALLLRRRYAGRPASPRRLRPRALHRPRWSPSPAASARPRPRRCCGPS